MKNKNINQKKERKAKKVKPEKKKSSKGMVITLSVLGAIGTIGLAVLSFITAQNVVAPWYIYAYTAISACGILYFLARWVYLALIKKPEEKNGQPAQENQ